MRIVETYSHLNGLEFLLVHKPKLWTEIQSVISSVNAAAMRTKVSQEKNMHGQLKYSPSEMNRAMLDGFHKFGWSSKKTTYYVTKNPKLIRETMQLPPADQKIKIAATGETPLFSYNQTDFVKERIAVEVQFGKYFSVAYDLFVKHMAFYVRDEIDLGVEIIPMKELQKDMSSGPPHFEGELYNLIRQGRGVPAVPLVIVGIAP